MSTLNLPPPQTYSRLFRPWDTNTSSRNSSCSSSSLRTAASVKGLVSADFCSKRTPSLSVSSKVAHLSMRSSQAGVPDNSQNACIKIEHTREPMVIDEERECPSSNSCSSNSSMSTSMSNTSMKSSYEDSSANSCHSPSLKQTSVAFSHASKDLTYRTEAGHHKTDHQAKLSYSKHAASEMTHFPHQPLNFHCPSQQQQQHQEQHHLQHQQHILNNLATANSLYYAAAASANVNLALGPSVAAAPPLNAMDAYALGFMEQEYARVLAEEAQLKAMNARKQRPKKFKCPHCDVAFSNNGQLKGHIRIHTGERPYKCDVETCGKTFTRNEELTRHKRIHTGLRPYPCEICSKKFGRRDHLKKHMKTHMPQDRHLGPAFLMPMYPYIY